MTPRIEDKVKVSETSTNAWIRWDSHDKRKDQIQWHKNSGKWGWGPWGRVEKLVENTDEGNE